jgi:hypothetical protein
MDSYSISIFGGIIEAWDIKPLLLITTTTILLIEKTKDLFLATSSSCLNYSDSNFDINSLIEKLNYLIAYRLVRSYFFKYLFSNLDLVTALVKE